jgi:hypothetical protein
VYLGKAKIVFCLVKTKPAFCIFFTRLGKTLPVREPPTQTVWVKITPHGCRDVVIFERHFFPPVTVSPHMGVMCLMLHICNYCRLERAKEKWILYFCGFYRIPAGEGVYLFANMILAHS